MLSSFVPANNASPVSVNTKMVQLCSETFVHTELVTANFPEEAVKDIPKDRFTLTNIDVSFPKDSSLGNIFRYAKMQFKMIGVLKKRDKKDLAVLFWLSGPMILPFIYCKVARFYTVGFLYGNSRKKADRVTLFNCMKAKLMEIIAKRSNLMCMESPSVAAHWGLPYDPQKIQLVHLFVDTEKFSPDRQFDERPLVIGMCGRLAHSKRIVESIQAFHQLKDKYPNYKMEIAGNGPLMRKCQQLIEQLGETDRIRLLGWVDNDSLPHYIRRWRLMLAPTNYEGIPNSLLEAMACGTPALSSPVGGIPDVIENGVDGWLLPDNKPETIARWLDSLLEDQAKLAEASVQSRKKVLERYSFMPALHNFRKFAQRIRN